MCAKSPQTARCSLLVNLWNFLRSFEGQSGKYCTECIGVVLIPNIVFERWPMLKFRGKSFVKKKSKGNYSKSVNGRVIILATANQLTEIYVLMQFQVDT